MRDQRIPLDEYFWSKVEKTETCWLWRGVCHDTGYGRIHRGPKKENLAHRYSWEHHFGPIPEGLFVCHRCDVRNCVRPDHLFVGTNHENILDAIKKGRHSPPPTGRGEDHNQSRFTEKDIRDIRSAIFSKRGDLSRLARFYDVHPATINNIRKGRSWRHIP